MSITDLSSFASITADQIQNLYKSTTSYQALWQETESQLSQVSNRIAFSSVVDTAIENALVGVASTIGSTGITYGTWKVLSILEDYIGEIKIPSIFAMGSGIGDVDLLNLAQTGMVGLGLIGSLLGGLGSMLNGGPTDLSNWSFKESRGTGLALLNTGTQNTTSYSAKVGVGNVSASDVEAVSMQSGAESAESANQQTMSAEQQEAQDIYNKIYEAISDGESVSVLTVLQDIRKSVDSITYRAATTSSAGTAQQISYLALSAHGVSGTATSESHAEPVTAASATQVTSSSSSGVGGSSTSVNNSNIDLETIITTAVETAIRNIAGYSSGSGLPVTVTNINNIGG